MNIFEISIEQLQDGTFQPTLSLTTERGKGFDIQNFSIPDVFTTEVAALQSAKLHALNEAQKLGLNETDFQIIDAR